MLTILALFLALMPAAASAEGAAVTLQSPAAIQQGGSVTVTGTSSLDEIIVKVLRPGNSVVFYDIIKVNEGRFSTTFTLAGSEPAGTYKIIAGERDQVDTKELVVSTKSSPSPSPTTPGPTASPSSPSPTTPNPTVSPSSPTDAGTIMGPGISTPKPSSTPVPEGKATIPTGSAGEAKLGDEIVVAIPAGAADKELTVTVEKVKDTASLLKHGEQLASPVFELKKDLAGDLDKPVIMSLKFDPAKVGFEQYAAIFAYDETTHTWVEVGGEIIGDTIQAEVGHFGKYAVLAVDKPAASYEDTAGHWAEKLIRQAAKLGIVSGYPDGSFRPEGTVTRAEFSIMLMNALKPAGAGAEPSFADPIPVWAQQAVGLAVSAGIVNGYEDGTFRPAASISRAELAVMIARAAGFAQAEAAAASFADEEAIPVWAQAAASAIRQAGIVEGRGGNLFAPNDTATRAEAVTVVMKLLEYMKLK